MRKLPKVDAIKISFLEQLTAFVGVSFEQNSTVVANLDPLPSGNLAPVT